jgi:hypothetical protein
MFHIKQRQNSLCELSSIITGKKNNLSIKNCEIFYPLSHAAAACHPVPSDPVAIV